MDKQEEFKLFIQEHPVLINYIKNKEMTFQDFYEIFDIYGKDENIWSKYFEERSMDSGKIKELGDVIKNFNMDKIQHHINNAQKVIGILQELSKKEEIPKNIIEEPINNFFGD